MQSLTIEIDSPPSLIFGVSIQETDKEEVNKYAYDRGEHNQFYKEIVCYYTNLTKLCLDSV